MELIKRFFDPPAMSYFLFGPRGTGKTKWVRHLYGDKWTLYIDLLDPEIYRTLLASPEGLIERVEGLETKIIIIDEVQKVPELLDVVHLLIERHKETRFILTGSSARKLRNKGVNLLGGRALNLHMYPYMAGELGDEFSLEKALIYGMLPLVWGSNMPQKVLDAYISIYLKEEVQMEGMVRNIGNFARFLESISFSQGSTLNMTNIARESAVGRKAVEGYVSILEDLLLSFRLEVFSKRAKRELAMHSKFYYFDCGVYRSLRPKGPVDNVDEIDGVALESLVAQHLRAWCDYSGKGDRLYYWQTRSRVEVDFVVYGESSFYAFEVKNTARCNRSDLRSLKTFGEDYPEAKRFFLYRGKDRLRIDGILCIPCEEFLLGLIPGKEFETN